MTQHTPRVDITVTIQEWLSRHFAGQVLLWVGGHVQAPHFITRLTLWAVQTASRCLEPLLLVCAAYLMISAGIPAALRPDLHNFSLSVLIGAPDIILPGGSVAVWQKFSKKAYAAGSILTVLLVGLAVLTGIANAEIFGVMHMGDDAIKQLLFWRAMLGTAYSTTIIITLLTGRDHQEETVHLPLVNARLDEVIEQQARNLHEMEQRFSQQVQMVQSVVHEALDEQWQKLPRLVQSLLPETGQTDVQPLTLEQVHGVVQSSLDGHIQPLAEHLQGLESQLAALGKVIESARSVETKNQAANDLGSSARASRGGSTRSGSEPAKVVQLERRKQGSEPATEPPNVRVPRFIREQIEQGHEPSLTEIVNHCECSKNTAIRYRRELLGEDQQEA